APLPKAGAKVHLIPTITKYTQRFFPGIIKIFCKYTDNKLVTKTRKLAGEREEGKMDTLLYNI
ncbi:MAG TPA: hypothetical protein H9950_04405, partial [Candidatus Bacteroides avicola]|nr:hypothetical protein [Candidatus Bacteroides avicola]